MKPIAWLLPVILGVTLSAVRADAPYPMAWCRQTGTPGDDISHSVTIDAGGNAYITGWTDGDLAGASAGQVDAFLAKYDASGNPLWTRQIGTRWDDLGQCVAVDASGNAFVCGHTTGSFGGAAQGIDPFVAKYDSSGNRLWLRQIGTWYKAYGKSVAIDASGNALVSGYIHGSPGDNEAFLIKYDGGGNRLWSREIGTPSHEFSESVAVDASGNACISGYTEGSLGGMIAGSCDVFVAKYDSLGHPLWSRQLGTPSPEGSSSTTTDGAGNVYVTGWTDGSLGGASAGSRDIFLAKYDAAGNWLWSRQIGTSSWDISHAVAVDADGGVYISGYTSGLLGEVSDTYRDAFLVKYDESGTRLWSRQIATSELDESFSVAVGPDGSAYISGTTGGELGGAGAGGYDAFLVKYEVPEPASAVLLACGSVVVLRRRRRSK